MALIVFTQWIGLASRQGHSTRERSLDTRTHPCGRSRHAGVAVANIPRAIPSRQRSLPRLPSASKVTASAGMRRPHKKRNDMTWSRVMQRSAVCLQSLSMLNKAYKVRAEAEKEMVVVCKTN